MKDNKRTYTIHKEHGEDISHENETVKDFKQIKSHSETMQQDLEPLPNSKIQDIVILYGTTELPVNEKNLNYCKIRFKTENGDQREIKLSKLIHVFNNNI